MVVDVFEFGVVYDVYGDVFGGRGVVGFGGEVFVGVFLGDG